MKIDSNAQSPADKPTSSKTTRHQALDRLIRTSDDSLESDLLQNRSLHVNEIAKQRLAESISPRDFAYIYSGKQRDRILRDQFIKKVPTSELMPYLLADKEYMIHHFRNEDLALENFDEESSKQAIIPDETYYDFEEIEKTLRFSTPFLNFEQMSSIFSNMDNEVINSLKTLDLYESYLLQDLKILSAFPFDHLHEINCDSMLRLASLEGIPKKHNFREVNLASCSQLKSLAGLEGISIKKLNISGCFKLTDLTPLLRIRDLDVVNMSGCSSANPTPENVEVLKKLIDKGVKIHGEMNSLISWRRHYRNLFENTKRENSSSQIKV